MKSTKQALLKSACLAAGLLGAAASAGASTLTYDFSTAGDSANNQAYGGSSSQPGISNPNRWVASDSITGLNIGDVLSASGSWKNNANNNGNGTLYFGIFSGPLTSFSTALVATTLTCDATLSAICSASSNLSITVVADARYYLVFFSTSSGAGNAFKTGSTLSLTNNTPLPSDVPLPGTAALLSLGLIGIGTARRKQT